MGNTAAAIAQHESIERIDIAELNHQVIETAPEFRAANQSVYRDPRVRFIHDDGRSVLALTPERYDLITSEPPPPIQHGVFRLYSREYYEAAKARLSESGLVSQWLSVSQLPREAVHRIIGTFIEVFPDAHLFVGHGRELLLFGGTRPLDVGRLLARSRERGPVREDLERLGAGSAATLLGRFVAAGPALRRQGGAVRSIRDTRNDLGFLRLEPTQRLRIPYEPAKIWGVLARKHQAEYALLEVLSRSPGRLQYRIPDYPFDVLDLPGGDGRWARSAQLRRRYLDARRNQDDALADTALGEALARDPAQPWWLEQAARGFLHQREPRQALTALDRFAAIEPQSDWLDLAYGEALTLAGRYDEAAAAADRVLARGPDALAFKVRGDALDGLGKPVQALAAYQAALALEPRFLGALNAQARLVDRLRPRRR